MPLKGLATHPRQITQGRNQRADVNVNVWDYVKTKTISPRNWINTLAPATGIRLKRRFGCESAELGIAGRAFDRAEGFPGKHLKKTS
jgi:hypothetical protein